MFTLNLKPTTHPLPLIRTRVHVCLTFLVTGQGGEDALATRCTLGLLEVPTLWVATIWQREMLKRREQNQLQSGERG
jgi:hypothetical protein